LDWFGLRRQLRGLTEHRRCCFGINHGRCSDHHQLFTLDVVTATNADEEALSNVEVVGTVEDEDLEAVDGKQTLQEGPIKYYDKRQQLELVLAAQRLSEFGNREVDPMGLGEDEDCEGETKDTDIWKDATCLVLLEKGMLPDTIEIEEGKRAKK
jgi:hypothetical protein